MSGADVDERTRALNDIIVIARRHALSAADIAAVLAEGPTDAGHRGRGLLVHVLGILGGTFVFAGIGVFIALRWDELNPAARVIVTLGSGLAAFVLALLSTRDDRFSKVTAPLFLMAAALEPTGLFVAFDEFGSGGDWRWASLVTSGTLFLQFAATFTSIARSTPLFMSVVFGTMFAWTAMDLLNLDSTLVELVLGSSVLLAAVGIDRTEHRHMTPAFYLLGGAAFLYGVFDLVERTPLEILFLAVAAGFVYLAALLHSRTLLVVATGAILAYTGWFTSQHFAESVGWPIALIAFGLVMIGLSALAVRIDRNYVRGASGGPQG